MPDSTSCGMTVNGHFLVYSEEFYEVIGSDPQFHTVIETNAHEGPVYVAAERALYFTTVPAGSNVPIAGSKEVAVKRNPFDGDRFPLRPEAAETVRASSNMANGMTLDREGRLVICEQGTKATPARISRMDLYINDSAAIQGPARTSSICRTTSEPSTCRAGDIW
ncbi:MAG TPA: hypothetical protein VN256_27285 [Pyrinomonadaceae bacterium]|nr:hypothetical protein [Pyrinomonadaceae bacterium]